MRNISVILIISFLLVSCGTFKEAGKILRNEKTNTTDEFLIKKEPLILPPDYDKIPKPGTLRSKEMNEEDRIKKILKAPKEKINTNKNLRPQKIQ